MVRAKASRRPSKCWIWKAIQSAAISGGAGNCERGARSVVLACTPEDSERQELWTITGIDKTWGLYYIIGEGRGWVPVSL